jgi:hypothetical protein
VSKSCEITRLKGLGEISPAEFKQFIGPEMRLSQVEYAPSPTRPPSFPFTWAATPPNAKTTSWTTSSSRWRNDSEQTFCAIHRNG